MDNKMLQVLGGEYDNYLAPFFWLHNEDDSLIITELEKIYDSGIRAVCLESRTHQEFCREDWWSDCRLIMEFCKAHDMKVWILDDKHFPSGYANGVIAKNKKYAQWNITERHVDVAGPVIEGSVMCDIWREAPDEEVLGAFACRHVPDSKVLTGEIIDISGNIHGGNVYFDLPEGMWRIVILVKAQSVLGDRASEFCDKLNPDATRAFIKEVYQQHYDNLKEYFGNTFVGFFSDEPGFRNNHNNPNTVIGEIYTYYPWHESVKRRFEELYGEDGMKNLLALWFEFRDIPYVDYRVAYMDHISYEYSRNFSGMLADWCHSHGVEYIGHVLEDNHRHAATAWGAGHYFRAISPQDMAGIDVVLHQIIPGLTECSNSGFISDKETNNRFFNYYLAKLASSLCHYTPHMKGRAMCEIFGGYGWAEGSKTMKYLLDHMLVRGINFFVPHAFSPKLDPNDCPPIFYFGGKNSQYPYFGHIMGYANRMCHMLTGGIHHSSCAILYDGESHWTRVKHVPLEDVAKLLYDNLVDYDILPADVIESIAPDGTLGNEKYKLLIVPHTANMSTRVLNAIKNTKIPVIFISEVSKYGLERVSPTYLYEYLDEKGLIDVKSDCTNFNLRFMHIEREGAHIYMFSNEDVNDTIKTKINLSCFDGGKYAVYDGVENKAYVCESADSSIELELPPYNSRIIITGTDFDGIEEMSVKETVATEVSLVYDIALKDVDGESFLPYKTTDRLFSINGREGVSDFGGSIRYRTKIELDGECVLDLGRVGEIAEVSLNGQKAGTRLYPPYEFDLAPYAKKGVNDLEITVTTTSAYKYRDRFSKYMLFEPTGLLGPVTVKKQTKA